MSWTNEILFDIIVKLEVTLKKKKTKENTFTGDR